MPMIMYTFLESYDWMGKVIIPFDTHEGSGQAQTVSSIRKECSGASVINGFSVRGSVAQNNGDTARETVKTWLTNNHFSEIAENNMVYTLQDIRNLQDFLLTRPTEEELTGTFIKLMYQLNISTKYPVHIIWFIINQKVDNRLTIFLLYNQTQIWYKLVKGQRCRKDAVVFFCNRRKIYGP